MFRTWCVQNDRLSLPAEPETLRLFAASLLDRGLKVTTVARRACGVCYQHKVAGLPSPFTPELKSMLKGARRLRCDPVRQMRPLTVEQLRKMAGLLSGESTFIALRARALLLLGFASALRSWNITALDLDDVAFSDLGVTLRIRREKQDQEGKGRWVGLPYGRDGVTCPVRCLQAWLQVRGDAPGPLFTRRAGHLTRFGRFGIWDLVKKLLRRIGEDPQEYGSHSLRAGFITAAGEAGCNHLLIAAQSGHRSLRCLQRYFRRTDLFRSNACSALGL